MFFMRIENNTYHPTKGSLAIHGLASSHVGEFYLSQMNTDEQISQRCTETLSQPISQNVTANVN